LGDKFCLHNSLAWKKQAKKKMLTIPSLCLKDVKIVSLSSKEQYLKLRCLAEKTIKMFIIHIKIKQTELNSENLKILQNTGSTFNESAKAKKDITAKS